MDNIFNIGLKAWAGSAQTHVIPLAPIPDGVGSESYRLRLLMIESRFDITTGVAGDVTSDDLISFMGNILVKGMANRNLVNIKTQNLLGLVHMWSSKLSLDMPADIGASATNAIRHLRIFIPYALEEFAHPQDGHVPGGLFNGARVKLGLGGSVIGTDGVVNAQQTTIRVCCDLVDEVTLNAVPFIGDSNIQKNGTLSPGVYLALLIRAPSAGFTDADDIGTVSLKCAGIDVIDNVEVDGLLARYFHDRDRPFSVWNEAAGAQSWEEFADTQTVIPLLYPDRNPAMNKLGSAYDTMGSELRFDLRGNVTDIDVVYWRLEDMTEDTYRVMASKLGVKEPMSLDIVRKTMSKVGLTESAAKLGRGMRVLPMKIKGESIKGALGSLAFKVRRGVHVAAGKFAASAGKFFAT